MSDTTEPTGQTTGQGELVLCASEATIKEDLIVRLEGSLVIPVHATTVLCSTVKKHLTVELQRGLDAS
jgi:hypothetical protein